MKPLKEYLDIYATYHQNPTNIVIHIICVPLIMWSLLGLVWSIPVPDFLSIMPKIWVRIFIFLAVLFYWRLSPIVTLWMVLLSIACLVIFDFMQKYFPFSIIYVFTPVFILAWIGQFIGHKIEGKKPAFMQDIFFLLIGPVWVLKHLRLLGNL